MPATIKSFATSWIKVGNKKAFIIPALQLCDDEEFSIAALNTITIVCFAFVYLFCGRQLS